MFGPSGNLVFELELWIILASRTFERKFRVIIIRFLLWDIIICVETYEYELVLFNSCSCDCIDIVFVSIISQKRMLGVEFFNVANKKHTYNIELLIWLRIFDDMRRVQ